MGGIRVPEPGISQEYVPGETIRESGSCFRILQPLLLGDLMKNCAVSENFLCRICRLSLVQNYIPPWKYKIR